MKLYRKLICALLLAATLFGLVACSGGGEPGKTETKPSGTKVTDESVTTEEPRTTCSPTLVIPPLPSSRAFMIAFLPHQQIVFISSIVSARAMRV